MVRQFHGASGYEVGPRQVEAIAMLCAAPDLGAAWLVCIGERDVGYALAYRRYSIDHGGWAAILDDLWIDPSIRGEGLGRMLLEVVCDELSSDGVQALFLETDPSNAAAMAFYSRSGFNTAATIPLVKTL